MTLRGVEHIQMRFFSLSWQINTVSQLTVAEQVLEDSGGEPVVSYNVVMFVAVGESEDLSTAAAL